MNKNIELEFRANLTKKLAERVDRQLTALAKRKEVTKRISFMSFGSQGSNNIDIRVRLTNGKSEVVIKTGELHSHKRIELSQTIGTEQFMGFVKLFTLFNYETKIAERVTTNYYLKNNIVVSIVQAKSIFYLEIEKLSHISEIEKNTKILKDILKKLGLSDHIINTKAAFDQLCSLLSKKTDWTYKGSMRDEKRLKMLIKRFI
ncbi:MAG: hypothetical protein IT410_04160 [Candidatus Doudnabacteria bacterium]|nr:hypothetical protein [Candidatus Doudnabacteria bacterium]